MSFGPLLAAVLVSAAVVIAFSGLWWRGRAGDAVDARLAELGATAAEVSLQTKGASSAALLRPGARAGSLSGKVADKLSQADLPLTSAEFALILLALSAIGFAVAWWQGGPLIGLLGAAVLGVVPFIYLTMRAGKRRKAFIAQLPDVLTLMVGGLRAGYGLTQAMQMLAERLPQPSATEFARAMRAVGLGMPVTKALNDMAQRVGSDDLYLVVTAMAVQQELGGNLAQILDTIAETIRGRIRIKREIQVMTSQQRITGVILSLLPVAAVIIIGTLNRDYMSSLFSTFIGRIMVGMSVFLMFVGYLVMRKIVDIEV